MGLDSTGVDDVQRIVTLVFNVTLNFWHTLVTCKRIGTVVFIVTPYILMHRSGTGVRQSALWSGDVQMACDFLVYN